MKIIFVYNADSGFVNTLLDIGHKMISPNTYECNLCQMTYGVFKEREKWKNFRESSTDELEFLHRDEFEEKYQEKRDYPIILKQSEEKNELVELLSKDQLNQMKDVEQLMQKLKEISR